MRNFKLMKKAIPYLLFAVIAYLIYTAHATEGFATACPAGKVPKCTLPYKMKDNKCIKDISGSSVGVEGPAPSCV